MQHDTVIWDLLNKGFCSFKAKINTNTFCRNKYNLTGLCNRTSCPLGNSRYATVREHEGKLYLYMKTIERAHTPAKMWERVLLSPNYAQAVKMIDEQLEFWPEVLKYRCKQRVTRIHEYLSRMRKLKLRETQKLVRVDKKNLRRDKVREARALKAARLTRAIEKELLSRLNDPEVDVYNGIYNFPQKVFKTALNEAGAEGEEEPEEELEMDMEEDDEEMMEDEYEEEDEKVGQREAVDEFVEDLSDDLEDLGGGVMMGRFAGDIGEDDEEDEELDQLLKQFRVKKRAAASNDQGSNNNAGNDDNEGRVEGGGSDSKKPRRRRPRVEIETEMEREQQTSNNNNNTNV